MQTRASRGARLSTLLAAAALAGCASGTYRTPEAQHLATSAVAVLEQSKPAVVTVSAVNGKSRPWGLFERYELLPGLNRVTVRLVEGGTTRTSDPLELEFTAESAATYVLRGSSLAVGPSGGRWNAWVTHKQSGKTVSSPAAK